MLVSIEWNCSKGFSSEFNASELDGDSKDQNYEEERVVEEIFKYINFRRLEFTCINFIKNLHQNESMEEDTVMLSCLVVPFFNAN